MNTGASSFELGILESIRLKKSHRFHNQGHHQKYDHDVHRKGVTQVKTICEEVDKVDWEPADCKDYHLQLQKYN